MAEKVAFTPGPWRLRADDPLDPGEILDNGFTIEMVVAPEAQWRVIHFIRYAEDIYPEDKADYPEAEANAQLIAAAPDLYDGLLELLDAVESDLTVRASSNSGCDDDDFREEFPVPYERCKRLRSILARARGEA